MSVETWVYIGTYLVCTPKLHEFKLEGPRCSADADHNVYTSDRFCSTCGAKVIQQSGHRFEPFTLYNVMNADQPLISDDDKLWMESFIGGAVFSNENIDDDTTDDFLPFDMLSISANTAGVDEPSTFRKFKLPWKRDLAKLQRIMGYTHIEVRQGVIVEQA